MSIMSFGRDPHRFVVMRSASEGKNTVTPGSGETPCRRDHALSKSNTWPAQKVFVGELARLHRESL
jgi:hypothetical protein